MPKSQIAAAVASPGELKRKGTSSQATLKELFAAVTTALRRVLSYEFSHLYVYDPGIGQLRTQALYFPNGKGLVQEGLLCPIKKTPAGWVYQRGVALRMNRPDAVRRPNAVVDRLLAEGVRSGCCVPLLNNGDTLGVLSVGSPREGAFSDQDQKMLCAVARVLATAMDGRHTPASTALSQIALTEAAWVAGAKAGFGLCFDELVRKNEARILRLAMRITRNESDAEDAMQETFLKAYEHLGEFRGDSRFSTWLTSIAIREALLKLRNRRPRQISVLEFAARGQEEMPYQFKDGKPTPEQRYSQTELRQVVSKAVIELPAPYRIVLALRDLEGFSTTEAAQFLGISGPAIKSRLLRARLKMRAHLDPRLRIAYVQRTRRPH